ncbi:serine/threonine protein kinase [Planctellipticum variicoloris]|uniref:serine/threonine protein kinase n=1 Tax=Planctellipticum variicoloris TaxID=3064265 RepID=UPI002C010E8D|nr:serine/threonine protein kinase [Planctomycetaceae bacterium SH412]HTN03004.1 serine/threonine-protein kinase [Planctomycetaceae bacterium]
MARPQPTPDRQAAAAAASREIPASAASRETKKPTDSVPMATGPFAALPARFGRYQVEKLLGRGMMGAVYLARDTQLDRLVALKIPRVSASGSAKLLKRLEVEAKAAAKLHHPNICSVYDYGVLDDVHFIALQYVEGQDLKSWLKRRGRPLAPAAAIRLMSKLAAAVGEAHRQEIIHRDLKPENIMLKPDGDPVIMDFGLARRASGATDAGLTQGMIVGTALYMSPEQANGRAEGIDHRSDIYALGVMLYELLTGAWPFSGGAMEVMGQKSVQDAPSPLSVDETLPPQLAALCHKMLARRKEDRVSTCDEVVATLESIDLNAPATDSNAPLDGISPASAAHEPKPIPGRRKTGRPPLNLPTVLAPLQAWWSRFPPVARWTALGGAGALSVALGVMLFFQTPDGVLQIEIDDPTLSVKFDGQAITIDNDGQPIRVAPTATHTLEILQNGVTVDGGSREISVTKGEKRLISVSLVEGQVTIDGEVIAAASTDNPPPAAATPAAESTQTSATSSKPAEPANARDGIVNGDFSKGLSGWTLDRGTEFNTFPTRGGRAMTSHGRSRGASTGRMHQTFQIPDKARSLNWYVHGAKVRAVHVALICDGKTIYRTAGPDSNTPVPVSWDLRPLQGKTVTLEIVDRDRRCHIGAHGFEIRLDQSATGNDSGSSSSGTSTSAAN